MRVLAWLYKGNKKMALDLHQVSFQEQAAAANVRAVQDIDCPLTLSGALCLKPDILRYALRHMHQTRVRDKRGGVALANGAGNIADRGYN
ncbi:hypothetical protein KSP40_PGU014260 [Platanthera guangdongensis]|uniref:Uncharacterized protein n=1 Tax=Platanthera guangdongensis TaxID=2320717 RepID=A0ABR2LIY0_9ASPA